MKTKKIIYWAVTTLLSVLCIMGSFVDIAHKPDAVALITHLGYPIYFISFIGILRLFGIIAILVPGYPMIKEWAYAGLFFDMFGALYSAIANGDALSSWIAPLIAMLLVIGSYILYHQRSSDPHAALQRSM
jgi:hypothetical protein